MLDNDDSLSIILVKHVMILYVQDSGICQRIVRQVQCRAAAPINVNQQHSIVPVTFDLPDELWETVSQ